MPTFHNKYEPEHAFSIHCRCYDCARWKKKHPKKWKKLYIEEQKQRRANRLLLNENKIEKFFGRIFGQATK